VAAVVAPLLTCVGARSSSAARASTASAGDTNDACAGASLRPRAGDLAAVDAATLCLVNRLRRSHGLGALRANRELAQAAAGKASGMVRADYFADVGPSGRTAMSLVAATGYRARAARVAVGQNLAWGTGSEATPARIVAQWLASPPHRRVMLSGEYRDAGVGVIAASPAVVHAGGRGATYVLELAARRR